jgi:hypothetical protein
VADADAVDDTTRAYFERLAAISPPEQAGVYKTLVDPKATTAATARAQNYLREREPGSYSMLRTSVVPTMMSAGVGANVIPSEGTHNGEVRRSLPS